MSLEVSPGAETARLSTVASLRPAADPPAASVIVCGTPRQLEVFVAAAEDCHFVRTANRLGITQAAISTHIAALERLVGKPLFLRRRGRKPFLSSHGLALLDAARAALIESGPSPAARPSRAATVRRSVRVGAGGHLLDDFIKPRLPGFCIGHPEIDLACVYVDSPGRCAELVADGRIDFFVYTVANPTAFRLHAEILKVAELGLYVGGRLAADRPDTPARIASLPFILPPEDSPACRMMLSALRTAGIECDRIAAHVQFHPVAREMARQGEGVAVLLESMLTPQDASDLVRLDVVLPSLYRTLFRAQRDPDPALRPVERFLREALSA